MMRWLKIPGRAWNYVRGFWDLGGRAKRYYGASRWHMMKEQLALRRSTRLSVPEYFLFGLCDPGMAWERKREYIGASLMRPLWSALNPIEYRYIFKNKLVFKHICQAVGLSQAELLGVFDPVYGYTASGEALRSAGDLESWGLRHADTEFVIKPAEGAEGQMVRSLRVERKGASCFFRSVDGTEWDAATLHEFMTDMDAVRKACSGAPDIRPVFLLEERLSPHPGLASLNPYTLCTFRIVTLRCDAEEPVIISTAYKLQSGQSGADNFHEGSIAVSVDPGTGVLGSGWTAQTIDGDENDGLASWRRLEVDPSTGIRFAGTQVPCWEEAKALALKAARCFFFARAVGWDIAVTPDGPKLQEGNWAWDHKLSQGGQGRGLYYGPFKELCERLRAEGKADKALV